MRYELVRELVKNPELKIKDIAEQTGYNKGHVSRLRKEARLNDVIAQAVAAEREACAKVCEGLFQQPPPYTTYAEAIARDCADAIRARKEK